MVVEVFAVGGLVVLGAEAAGESQSVVGALGRQVRSIQLENGDCLQQA